MRRRGWQISHTWVARLTATIFTTVLPHRTHGSPARRWIEELVLEGALDAAGVAEVVDRRGAGGERIGDREAIRVEPRALQAPHWTQRLQRELADYTARVVGAEARFSRRSAEVGGVVVGEQDSHSARG